MFEPTKFNLPIIPPGNSNQRLTYDANPVDNEEINCSKLFLATVLHGVTKAQCVSIHNHLGYFNNVSELEWNKLLVQFKSDVRQLVNICLINAMEEEITDSGLEIMSDGCWNVRGFCSPLGTVSALGLKTKKIVGVSVLINEGKVKNCDVTSKAMEGLGTERICEFFQNNGINVKSFLHDGDGSAFNAVLKSFPACVEMRCINHAAKNIGKWATDVLGARFGPKIRYAFWFCCRNASKAPNPELELKNEFKEMLNHFGGIHTLCKHHKTGSKPQKWYLDAEKVEVLRKKLNEFYEKPLLFSHGKTQSLVESFNKEITEFAPKHLLVPSLYECRILLAVLKHNLGPAFVYDIYEMMNLPIPLAVENQIAIKIAKREYFHHWVAFKKPVKKKFAKQKQTLGHFYKEELKEPLFLQEEF